jgi:glycosyltransferase involved in cell wall biosynthesis
MALHALHRRRPDLRFVMFGDNEPLPAPFPYEHIGIATPEQLSWVFSEATVGLCLSLTNYSLIPQEMMACGLPCVDLAAPSSLSVFGADGPVRLAPVDVDAIAGAVEDLLDDGELWERSSRRGLEYVAGVTWDAASEQVEQELRNALRAREPARA